MPEPAVGKDEEPVGVAVAVAKFLPRFEHLLGEPAHQRAVGDSVEEEIEVGDGAERTAIGAADHRDGVDVGAADRSGDGRGREVAASGDKCAHEHRG